MAERPAAPDGPAALKGAHILHVADRDVLARFGLMFSQLLPALAASGLRVSLLSDDEPMLASFEGTPVERHRVEHLHGWRAWRLGSVLGARFGTPPKIAHLWGTASLRWMQGWLRSARVPTVIHALGASHIAHLARRGIRSHERVVSASRSLLEPLVQHHPLAAGACQTILPGVAPPLWPERELRLDHTLGVLCVTHLGNLAGLVLLMQAAAQLRRTAFDLQIAVVGAGSLAHAAWNKIRGERVQDCLSIVDEPGLWERVLPGVDVCVVPTRQQELWLAPLLAMALGKAVIASRDQVAEWYVENRTCWQFTPGSAVELAYLLERVTAQPKHVQELCAGAAEYVRERHTISELIEHLLALYGAALADRHALSGG